jgi:hypothetical protein
MLDVEHGCFDHLVPEPDLERRDGCACPGMVGGEGGPHAVGGQARESQGLGYFAQHLLRELGLVGDFASFGGGLAVCILGGLGLLGADGVSWEDKALRPLGGLEGLQEPDRNRDEPDPAVLGLA